MALDRKALSQTKTGSICFSTVSFSVINRTTVSERNTAAEFAMKTVTFSGVSKPDKAAIPVYQRMNKKYPVYKCINEKYPQIMPECSSVTCSSADAGIFVQYGGM